MVLCLSDSSGAYRLLLWGGVSVTFADSTTCELLSSIDNYNWRNGDQDAPTAISGGELREPPAFWDTSSVGFVGGANSGDMHASDQVQSLQQAVSTWNAVSQNLTVSYDSTTTRTWSPNDGVNVIAWGEWADLGTSAGITLLRLEDTAGDDYAEILEVDILLNDDDDYWRWTLSTFNCTNDTSRQDTVDVQSIATHELGHALGLAHSFETSSADSCPTMLGAGNSCSATCKTDRQNLGMRSLQSDDRDGLLEIYGPTADGYYVRSEAGADKPLAPTARPTGPDLLRAYPNPFNPEVTIEFVLANAADIDLWLTNALGQRIDDIASGKRFRSGRHTVAWRTGSDVSSGVYVVWLRSPEGTWSERVTVLR